jgi:ketosteroid isomerase-like protein
MLKTACLLVFAFAAAAHAQTPAETIRQLDARWARMYAENDTVTASRLYADDLIFTSTDGSQKDKAREMNDVRAAPGLTLHYFRTVNPEIRVFGSGAVAAGLAEWSFTMNGQKSDVKRRYTIVYAQGGPLGWRIVAVHMGRAP